MRSIFWSFWRNYTNFKICTTVAVGCVAIKNPSTKIDNLIATHLTNSTTVAVGCVAIKNPSTKIDNLIATHLTNKIVSNLGWHGASLWDCQFLCKTLRGDAPYEYWDLRPGQETGFLRVFGLDDEKYWEKPGFWDLRRIDLKWVLYLPEWFPTKNQKISPTIIPANITNPTQTFWRKIWP